MKYTKTVVSFVCDRCGKDCGDVETVGFSTKIAPWKLKEKIIIVAIILGSLPITNELGKLPIEKSFDLCLACSGELKSWLCD